MIYQQHEVWLWLGGEPLVVEATVGPHPAPGAIVASETPLLDACRLLPILCALTPVPAPRPRGVAWA